MLKRFVVPTVIALSCSVYASSASAQEDAPTDEVDEAAGDEEDAWPEYGGHPEGAPPPKGEEEPTRRRRRRPRGRRGPPPGYDRRSPPPGGYNYAGPRVIENWEPGDPVPEGYKPGTQSRSGLVKAGAAVLFSMYGVTAVAASFLALAEDIDLDDGVDDNGVDPDDWYPLFIPVAGPFITVATAETERAGTTLLIVNGVIQVSGLALFIAGFAAQEDVLVRIPTYAGGPTMELAPLVGKDFQGVGVNGTF